jgi:hypothetical protein
MEGFDETTNSKGHFSYLCTFFLLRGVKFVNEAATSNAHFLSHIIFLISLINFF